MQGLLASIHDILTNNFISNIANDNPVWIGGFNQNGWTWEDGSLWDYSNWGPNEPNNQDGDEAYVMTNWGGRGLWNDAHKGYEFHFVCQSNERGTKRSYILGLLDRIKISFNKLLLGKGAKKK